MQNNEIKNEEMWTIRSILAWTTRRFKQAGLDTPLLDAQLLLCRILNTNKINLYMDIDRPLSAEERAHLREFVKRRLSGEPVAYILNEKYWFNLKIYVDKHVLIPRPETECLLDFTLETIKFYQQEANQKISRESRIVLYDFCTGSGCIAIAFAKVYPDSKIIAIDISQDALDIAKKNAQINNVTNIEWLQLDLTQSESYNYLESKYGKADAIVANPPYISEQEWHSLDISIKNFEPKIALTAKENGFYIAKEIINNINKTALLKENFHVFCMEMANNHPQQLINSALKNFHFNSIPSEKPVNEWFSLCDLENKNRFLCKIGF